MNILDLSNNVLDMIMRYTVNTDCMPRCHYSMTDDFVYGCSMGCCLCLSMICHRFYRVPILDGMRQINQAARRIHDARQHGMARILWYPVLDTQPVIHIKIKKHFRRGQFPFLVQVAHGRHHVSLMFGQDNNFGGVKIPESCAKIVFYHPHVNAREIIDRFKGESTKNTPSCAVWILCNVTQMWKENTNVTQKELMDNIIVHCEDIVHHGSWTSDVLTITAQNQRKKKRKVQGVV